MNKKIMMAMCAILILCSCEKGSKDEPEQKQDQEEQQQEQETTTDKFAPVEPKEAVLVNKDSLKVVVDTANLVNLYDSTKVPTANDIQIMNADTTLLKVSKAYFEKKATFNPHKGMVMVLQLDEYTVYNALVEDITDEGTYYSMKISHAPLNKVFPELEIGVTSEGANETKSSSRKSNMLHPFKIIVEHPDGTKEAIVPTRGQNGVSGDISLELDFGTGCEFGLKDHKFELGLYRNDDLTDNAKMDIGINCGLYIKYGKKIYDAKGWGSITTLLRLPVFVKFNQKDEKRYTIFTKTFGQNRYSLIVWAGPVPISFDFTPGVNLNVGATLKGDCSTSNKAFKVSFFPYAKASFAIEYKNDDWKATHSSEFVYDLDMPRMGENAKISLDAGVYPQLTFGIDHLDFLQGRIGPALVATASTGDKFHNDTDNYDETILDCRLSLDTKAYYWAGAKLFGLKVAGYSQWFTLSSTTLWEDKRDVILY